MPRAKPISANTPQFTETSKYENFNHAFSKYINKYHGHNKEFVNSCRGENSIMINENLVSYFLRVSIMVLIIEKKQL